MKESTTLDILDLISRKSYIKEYIQKLKSKLGDFTPNDTKNFISEFMNEIYYDYKDEIDYVEITKIINKGV